MSTDQFIDALEAEDANDLIDFVEATLDKIEGEEWQERTGEMLASALPALIWEKEQAEEEFDGDNLPALFSLSNIIRLSRLDSMPEQLKEELIDYLYFIPGFDDEFFDDEGKDISPEGSEAAIVIHQHDHLAKLFFNAVNS